jgi:hemerythrin
MIVWDETMSTGDHRLDAQHRMLFQKFNEFSAIIERRGEVREAAGEVLDFLQFYAIWHFGQEEDCMHRASCPAAASNKNAHAEFSRMFGEFYTRWQENTMDLEMALETHTRLAE